MASSEKVTFSKEELEAFETNLKALNEQLERLENKLQEAAADDVVDQQLAETNQNIQSLRRQWRAMLDLPPPKN